MDATFEDVVKLAEQLDPEQQNLLIYRLRVKQAEQKLQQIVPVEAVQSHLKHDVADYHPTRAELIAELDRLREAGAFEHVESLYGKYANPNIPDISEEEFHAQMHLIAAEWEQSSTTT